MVKDNLANIAVSELKLSTPDESISGKTGQTILTTISVQSIYQVLVGLV